MNFRKATIKDLNILLDIKEKVIEKFVPLGLNWTKDYPTKETFENDIFKNEVYILEDARSKKILGSVVLNSDEDENYKNVKWDNENEGLVVHRLMVNPDFSRRGLGKRILLEIESLAIKKGFSSIKLDTCTENIIGLKLYKSMDYNVLGEINLAEKGKDKKYFCLEKIV